MESERTDERMPAGINRDLRPEHPMLHTESCAGEGASHSRTARRQRDRGPSPRPPLQRSVRGARPPAVPNQPGIHPERTRSSRHAPPPCIYRAEVRARHPPQGEAVRSAERHASRPNRTPAAGSDLEPQARCRARIARRALNGRLGCCASFPPQTARWPHRRLDSDLRSDRDEAGPQQRRATDHRIPAIAGRKLS